MTYAPHPMHHQSFSIPSILAIAAAIGSFFVGGGWGILLAIVAIICGLIGFTMAMSPTIRGGIISAISILAGCVGIIVAIFKLVLGHGR